MTDPNEHLDPYDLAPALSVEPGGFLYGNRWIPDFESIDGDDDNE